jgi:hypothetical protein
MSIGSSIPANWGGKGKNMAGKKKAEMPSVTKRARTMAEARRAEEERKRRAKKVLTKATGEKYRIKHPRELGRKKDKMPQVGSKHFAYTPKGQAAAKAASKRMGKPVMNKANKAKK